MNFNCFVYTELDFLTLLKMTSRWDFSTALVRSVSDGIASKQMRLVRASMT